MWFTWERREGCGDESVGHPQQTQLNLPPAKLPTSLGCGDLPTWLPHRGEKDRQLWVGQGMKTGRLSLTRLDTQRKDKLETRLRTRYFTPAWM